VRATSFPIRVARILRLGLHVLHGVCLVLFLYSRCAPRRQQAIVQGWSRGLLSILNIRLRCHDAPQGLAARSLLVANHVSWLDIFAISALFPATFVAKSEIGGWPVLGVLCRRTHTIFIQRSAFRGVLWANRDIVRALRHGARPVALFPEGTTTRGEGLLPFRAALLQPAVNLAAPVRPLALRYFDTRGNRSDAAAWVGGASLVGSILALAAEPETVVDLRFLANLDSADRTRRQIATEAQAAIAHALRSEYPAASRICYMENENAAIPAPMAAPASTSVG
jgi:1-acyl-sn-glycerol-3-phosphate acyltransferase